jgi:hypothetical protein
MGLLAPRGGRCCRARAGACLPWGVGRWRVCKPTPTSYPPPRCRWFDGFDWEALAARKMEPPRLPKGDALSRLRDLAASERAQRPLPPDTPQQLAECHHVFKDF